jgi:broad specificity phosphatase PhoE
MQKLFLVRHGETIWNSERRYIGRTDLSLSDKGFEQAQNLAQRFAKKNEGEKIQAIWTSPLKRSVETAKIIGKEIGLEPEIINELIEVDFGEWEGLTYEEIKEKFGDLIDRWLFSPSIVEIPSGESWRSLTERVRNFLTQASRRPEKVALAITHGGIIKTITGLILDHQRVPFASFLISNASVSAIGFAGERPYLLFLNDTCHLRQTNLK